jgi:hypothetical protein
LSRYRRTFNLTRLEQRDGGRGVRNARLEPRHPDAAALADSAIGGTPAAKYFLQATLQDTRNAVSQEMKMTSLKTQRTAQLAATR